ncbi:MAG: VOC family protein [Chloroflexi bacterium]|nr:VOC family protein [Chloroflexota bacterium]
MIKGFGHIGIGVKDIEKSLEALSNTLGVPVPPTRELPERKAKVAVVDMFGIGLEFIQDDSENGLLATFVRERGEGIHHYCLLTDDIDADVQEMKERGVKMLHQQPVIGLRDKRIAFISPEALDGIFVELSEP